ncbi:hypothetical protein [Kordia sp.]|uniref:hypothetical protein n=1 Tax=Kordia sp. TaxID=1965332 RepID=UPI003B59928B
MGLFDRFKKNKKQDSNDNNLDLKNPIIKQMVEWLEHPMEFGKKPDAIEIVDKKSLFWPSQQQEDCYLLKYTFDGDEYIGFTGPTTWSFLGIDFSKVTHEELYLMYTGWFIAFFTSQSEGYDKSMEGNNEAEVIKYLEASGYENVETLQKVYLGERNYYEFSANSDGEKIKLVGIDDETDEYPADSILPFYHYIGTVWDPMN